MIDGLKDKHRQAIIDILAANSRVEQVTLFGSRAMGTFTTTSDVDLALHGNELTLTDQAKLAVAIDDLPMAQRVDLLLYKSIDNDNLKEHIRKYGVKWFRRDWGRSADWPIKTLDDVCEKITDGAHNSPKSVEIGKPMASVKDLTKFGVELKGSRHISEEDFDKLAKQGCKPEIGDVLIAKDGNSALDTVCNVKQPLDAVLLSSVAILRPDPKKITSDFLKYYFTSQNTINYLKGNFISGAAIPRVVLKDFKKAQIKLPPLEYQKKISAVLRSLDNKIELNHQINLTLEEIAQAIFKSWFVDFEPVKAKIAAKENGQDPERAAMCAISGKSDAELNQLPADQLSQLATTAALFPDELVESELRLIPKGWEVKTLSNLIDIIGGGTPKKSEPAYWGGNIPWFSVKDAPAAGDVFVINTEEKITALGLQKSSAKLLPVGVTIISARGTVGRLALIGTPMAMNQSCYGIQGSVGIGPYFNYFNLKNAVNNLRRNTHGAVFDTITRDTFDSVSALKCNRKLSDRFDEVVEAPMKKLFNNLQEIKSLTQLRDTLLPKLLSGEISVAETQAKIEAAV